MSSLLPSRQKACLLLCLFAEVALVSRPLAAQPASLRFEHLTNLDGLSQNTVFAIEQDRQGFLWFGTKVGVNRYDGYTFKIYTHDPFDPSTLTNSFVRVLLEDTSGILWIGTYGGGLNRFDPSTETLTAYRHDPDDPQSLSHDDIRAIHQDRSGALWIATQGAGLNRLDPETRTFTRYARDFEDPASLSHDDVRAIAEDSAGDLWIGTNGGGLNRLRREGGKVAFVRYRRQDGLIDNRVRALLIDRSGEVWVGTNGGLGRLDPQTGIFKSYRHDPRDPRSLSADSVRSLYQDSGGVLWVGTTDGLNRFAPTTETFERFVPEIENPFSLSGKGVYALFEDRSGGLWIGTYSRGLNRLEAGAASFAHYRHDPRDPESLSSNAVEAIHESRSGDLWVGTYGGGLNLFERDPADPSQGTFTHYRHEPSDPGSLADDRVKCVYEDRAGRLWVGTDRDGLDLFDPRTESFVHFRHDPEDPTSLSRNYIRAILEDRTGRLWIATQGGGLNRFQESEKTFLRYQNDPRDPSSLSHDSVFALHEDRGGNLWVGTYGGGLNRLEPSGAFVRYRYDPQRPDSLSNDEVSVIHEDRSGRLWIGTYGGGLNRFEAATETFVHYSAEIGLEGPASLEDPAILGILEDRRGRLWLSTNRGVARLDPETARWTRYDVRDGLQDIEFNRGAYFQNQAGEMFFGGNNGLNLFFPERFEDNSYVPPVVLTSFKIFEEEIKGTRSSSYLEKIELEPTENFFSFEFAALNFRRPDKNRYLYRLEGLDEDWVDPGARRFARYTHVPPGDYVFHVRGSNNDGVWNETGASVRIAIAPPFWRTLPFYLSIGAFIMLFLIASFRFFATRRYSRKLESEVLLRTDELRGSYRELSRKTELLEREIAEHEKTESKLRRARDEAQAASLAKSRFLATMSHEIRTPMRRTLPPTKTRLAGSIPTSRFVSPCGSWWSRTTPSIRRSLLRF